jgi:hypothetical protein
MDVIARDIRMNQALYLNLNKVPATVNHEIPVVNGLFITKIAGDFVIKNIGQH